MENTTEEKSLLEMKFCTCGHVEEDHVPGVCFHCVKKHDYVENSINEHLFHLAVVGLKMAEMDLLSTGQIVPAFLFEFSNGDVNAIKMPAEYASMLNSGDAKNLIFGAMRKYRKETKAKATVFATDSWMGKETEKFLTIPPSEYDKKILGKTLTQLVDEGYMERSEAICVNAQSEQRVVLVNHSYERTQNSFHWREYKVADFEQKHFSGCQKMFGDLNKDNIQ